MSKTLKTIGIIVIVLAFASEILNGFRQIGWDIFLAVIPIILLVWIFMHARKKYKVKDKL